MKKLILHIPRSAKEIPINEGFILNEKEIENEILKLTDWYTEDLYGSTKTERIVFEYSRIFCDPERFSDNSQEPMAKVGMGVLYEKTDEKQIMRIVSTELREKILSEYYFKHYLKLNNAVKKQLKLNNRALILDCHSFPEIPMKRSLHKVVPRPDYNIGTDKFHTPKRLIDISVNFFKKRDLILGIDYPFNGSIVPMEYYQEIKSRNDQKRLTQMLKEIKKGSIQTKETLKWWINRY
jgi:N-formylglutamate deformylase